MPAKKVTKKAAPKTASTKKQKKDVAKSASPAKKARASAKKVTKRKEAKEKPEVSAKKILKSDSFVDAESKAKEYAKDPEKLKGLFQDAAEKSKNAPNRQFGETWAYLQAMIRLIRAYAKGDYRAIPWNSLVMIVFAIIYFVSPIDAIPDWIPVAGFLDDALIVSLALKQVKGDLDAFMEWEVSGD
ncbi:MAG: YkvA family protein [Verrucomicrobiales bacterium]